MGVCSTITSKFSPIKFCYIFLFSFLFYFSIFKLLLISIKTIPKINDYMSVKLFVIIFHRLYLYVCMCLPPILSFFGNLVFNLSNFCPFSNGCCGLSDLSSNESKLHYITLNTPHCCYNFIHFLIASFERIWVDISL